MTLPTVSLTKFARDTLTEWQKLIDENGLSLKRDGMRTVLNLEIVLQQLILTVETAEKQAEESVHETQVS